MQNAYDLEDFTQPRFPGCNPQSSVGHVHGSRFIPHAGAFAHMFNVPHNGVFGKRKPEMAAITSRADAVPAAAPFLRAPESGGFLEQLL